MSRSAAQNLQSGQHSQQSTTSSSATSIPSRTRKDDWSAARLSMFPSVPFDVQEELEAAIKNLTVDNLPGRRKPHPLFTTSNGSYGKKKDTGENLNQPDMYGRSGKFTQQFLIMSASNRLNHTRNRNPVLPDPSFCDTPYYQPLL
jgi:hypothetical protein